MNDDLHAKISLFMDGEPDRTEDGFLEWLSGNEHARHTWWRYHIISDVLGQGIRACADRQLACRIAEKIRKEPAIFKPRSKTSISYLKPLAGLAIAASVAAVAILSVKDRGEQESHPSMAQPVAALEIPLPALSPRLNTVESTVPYQVRGDIRLTNADANTRMNSYLLNYYEYRSMGNGVQGVNPYVRIIANDPDQK